MLKIKNNKVFIGIWSGIVAFIIAFTLVLNILTTTLFDEVLRQFIGETQTTTSGNTEGVDTTYVKSSYSNATELYNAEAALNQQIAAEGVVLLKNDGILPLAANTTLSLFSHSSVDMVYGGTGSGSSSSDGSNINLKDALKGAGLQVNETLWNFYKSGNGSKYSRGGGVINYGASEDWKINECPVSVIQSESGLTATFAGTTAVFVISRTGGEGGDLPTVMNMDGGKATQHYLEIDDTEKQVIEYLNQQFNDVIIIVNTNNVMELGWINDYNHIKAVLNVPGMGATGLKGLADVLVNNVSPSGHLVDTLVYDNFSSPASKNTGDFKYSNANYYYVAYNEGIYVGYKYYETRYEDTVLGRGNTTGYKYSDEVLFPFGYGMSYTTFKWSDYNVTENNDGTVTVSLTVKNTTDTKGKDVVQIYAQAPYTGKVEKSAVELVGFVKTRELGKNEEQPITFTFNKTDLKSYDNTVTHDGVKGAYVLEAGDYYITAATDAHSAVNNILAAKGKTVDNGMTENGDKGLVKSFTWTEQTVTKGANDTVIQNQFDHATLDDVTYLTRSDWTGTFPQTYATGEGSASRQGANGSGKTLTRQASQELINKLKSFDSLNPNAKYTSMPKTNANNGLDAIDLRCVDFDDPTWDKLLEELNLTEVANLIARCGYNNPKLDSVNKPKLTDLDGPAGLNKVVGHGPIDGAWPAWTTEYLLACTWNEELAEQMGAFVGEDGLATGTNGWYAPAMNIHRTPFSGRNYEYYSEDGYLSGVMGSAAVRGAASKGMYAFIKHFALNDQETHRSGVATWANEQAIREIYLKPFEMCVKTDPTEVKYNQAQYDERGNITGYEMVTKEMPSCMALMTSFNRIGATWAGGNYNLLTGVLRNEWGFNGFVITDYQSYPDYMNTSQMLSAGGDAMMNTIGTNKTVTSDPTDAHYAIQAAKHIMYCAVNSAGMNGYIHGVSQVQGFPYYAIILIVWDVLAVAGLTVIAVHVVFRFKKKSVIEVADTAENTEPTDTTDTTESNE